MEKEFNRVHSATDIIISLILVAGGCCLLIPNTTSINVLGFFMIITGLVLALVMRTGYKDKETGERFRKTEKFFPAHCKDSISKAIVSSPDKIDLSEENKGNGLRLDTFFNTRTGHVFCRLYEYIPYRYQACTEFITLDMKQAEKLTK